MEVIFTSIHPSSIVNTPLCLRKERRQRKEKIGRKKEKIEKKKKVT